RRLRRRWILRFLRGNRSGRRVHQPGRPYEASPGQPVALQSRRWGERRRHRRMIRIRPVGGGPERRFGAEPVALGRAETNQVVVTNRKVSAAHALIVPAGGGYAVRDRGSTNGTAVVRGKARMDVGEQAEVRLESGDTLVLGGDEGAQL